MPFYFVQFLRKFHYYMSSLLFHCLLLSFSPPTSIHPTAPHPPPSPLSPSIPTLTQAHILSIFFGLSTCFDLRILEFNLHIFNNVCVYACVCVCLCMRTVFPRKKFSIICTLLFVMWWAKMAPAWQKEADWSFLTGFVFPSFFFSLHFCPMYWAAFIYCLITFRL